jgi:hypothetical protein
MCIMEIERNSITNNQTSLRGEVSDGSIETIHIHQLGPRTGKVVVKHCVSRGNVVVNPILEFWMVLESLRRDILVLVRRAQHLESSDRGIPVPVPVGRKDDRLFLKIGVLPVTQESA